MPCILATKIPAMFWIPFALKVGYHWSAKVHVSIKPKIDMIIERVFKAVKSPVTSVGNMP